jgi:lysophospholipase L1-like esterase
MVHRMRHHASSPWRRIQDRRRPRGPSFALRCCSALLALILTLLLVTPGTAPPAPTSLLFVGDSLTLGLYAADPQHTYAELLLDRLKEQRPVEWAQSVIEHPYGLTDNAEKRVIPYLGSHPQVVVVEVGTHEVHAPAEQQAFFAERYAHLLDRLAETRARIVVGTIPWLGYAHDDAGYREALRLNGIIRAEASARGDVVADLWDPTVGDYAILSRPGETTFIPPYQGDFFHPGNLGHEILASAFWPALDQAEQGNPQNRPGVTLPYALSSSGVAALVSGEGTGDRGQGTKEEA